MIINNIEFKNSQGIDKEIYPSVIVDFLKTSVDERNNIRREIFDLMSNQGFESLPKYIDINGNPILDKISVLDINEKYPGFKWVFYVEYKNLVEAEKISNKYKVDFYKNNKLK